MTTNIEQEREAFEAWAVSESGPLTVDGISHKNGYYWSLHARDFWQAWQARAAHVVEQEPVAASIESPEFWSIAYADCNGAFNEKTRLIKFIDQHCAAQVAQALAAADPMAEVNQTGAVNMKKIMVAPSHSPE